MGDILDIVVNLGLIGIGAGYEVVKKESIWSFEVVFPFHDVVNKNFQFVGVYNHRLWCCLYS